MFDNKVLGVITMQTLHQAGAFPMVGLQLSHDTFSVSLSVY